jgi:hypothetical protein
MLAVSTLNSTGDRMINHCGAAGGIEFTVASAGTSSSTAYKQCLRNSVKTLVNSSDGLNYLKQKFLKLSVAKFKGGVSVVHILEKRCINTITDSQPHSIRCIFKSLVSLPAGKVENAPCLRIKKKVIIISIL